MRIQLILLFFCFISLSVAAQQPNIWLEHIRTQLQQEIGAVPSDRQLVNELNKQASLLYQDGRYAEALEIFKTSWEYAKKYLGEEHGTSWIVLRSLGQVYKRMGKYTEAEQLLQKSLHLSKKIWGEKHPRTLFVLNILADLNTEQGHYKKAESLYQDVLPVLKQILGEEHPQTLNSMIQIALLYQKQGRYTESESLLKHTLNVSEQVLGEEAPQTLGSLNNLAMLYSLQDRYKEAEQLYQHVLILGEKVKGKNHPDTLSVINNLADLYSTQSHYDKALPLLKHVLDMSKQTLGETHPDTLITLHSLARLYKRQGRYTEAEKLYEEVKCISEQVLGDKHPNTLFATSSLAGVYERQGHYEKAEKLEKDILPIRKQILGEEHPDTLGSIKSLARLYVAQGHYGEAESLYQHVLPIYERVFGKNHLQTLDIANSFGDLYRIQDRYDEAESLLLRALEGFERVLGKTHPDTLVAINSLAALYEAQKSYKKAEQLYQRALQTGERVLGNKHPYILSTMNNLAFVYHAQELYQESESLYKRSLALIEEVHGKLHPHTFRTVNNLAVLYHLQNRYKEAEALYQRALATSKDVLGEVHPDTIGQIRSLISFYFSLQKPEKILPLLKRLQANALDYAEMELSTTIGEAQKRRFLTKQRSLQDLALSFAVQYPEPEHIQFAATVALRWNQVHGEEVFVLQRLGRQSNKTEVQELTQKIRQERTRLSRLANQQNVEPKILQTSLSELARLEVALSKLSRKYKNHLAVRNLDLDKVRNALPSESALLVLKAYKYFDAKEETSFSPRYLAFLIPTANNENATIQMLDLGKAKGITLRGMMLQTSMEDGHSDLYQQLFSAKDVAADLYQHLFAKWDTRLASFKSLYILPDHWLHLLNFERLKLPDRHYWIERQPLHRIQSAQDFIRDKLSSKGQGLVALGGIEYGTYADTAAQQVAINDTQRNLSRQITAGFKALEYSGKEAQSILNLFGSSESTQLWLGKEAREQRLKQLTQAPYALHLATHGFYLENQTKLDRAMVLSGLALANANQGIQGKLDQDGEDGVLYAMEVLDLNLEGTQLVTLSACDTGQGVVDYNEGVYGLLRAFRIAGVQHILMTLRSVGDKKAYRFMLAFYLRWFESGGLEHPAKALRDTKLHFIRSQKAEERDPEFWSPYVLVEMPAES